MDKRSCEIISRTVYRKSIYLFLQGTVPLKIYRIASVLLNRISPTEIESFLTFSISIFFFYCFRSSDHMIGFYPCPLSYQKSKRKSSKHGRSLLRLVHTGYLPHVTTAPQKEAADTMGNVLSV